MILRSDFSSCYLRNHCSLLTKNNNWATIWENVPKSKKFKNDFSRKVIIYKSKLSSGKVWLQCDDGKWLKYTNMYKGVIYPTWHTTCRSSGHSKNIHQLRWRINIANISNRLIGPQIATRYCVNASANTIFCQERTAISQTRRRKLAASYDRAYYKLWSPISWFRLRRRSVRFDKLRLNYLFVLVFMQYLVAICEPINLLAMFIRQRSWRVLLECPLELHHATWDRLWKMRRH